MWVLCEIHGNCLIQQLNPKWWHAIPFPNTFIVCLSSPYAATWISNYRVSVLLYFSNPEKQGDLVLLLWRKLTQTFLDYILTLFSHFTFSLYLFSLFFFSLFSYYTFSLHVLFLISFCTEFISLLFSPHFHTRPFRCFHLLLFNSTFSLYFLTSFSLTYSIWYSVYFYLNFLAPGALYFIIFSLYFPTLFSPTYSLCIPYPLLLKFLTLLSQYSSYNITKVTEPWTI